MSDAHIEAVAWTVGLAMYAAVGLAPRATFRVLGRGRAVPSAGTLAVFRVLAAVCVAGAAYHLAMLARGAP